jgi:hypothetical protein
MATALAACVATKGLEEVGRGGVETWEQIKDSGVNEEASYSVWSQSVEAKGESNTFTPDTEKVVWWATFGGLTFAAAVKPTFRAKWYAPDGTLFREKRFKKSVWNDVFLKTELEIAKTQARDLPGEWKVEVYYKDHLMDRKRFRLVSKEEQAHIQKERSKPLMDRLAVSEEEPLAKTKLEEASVGTAEADRFFQTNYDEAKQLFAKKEYVQAESRLSEVLKSQPYRTEAHFALASVLYHQGKTEEALKELEFVIQNPTFQKKGMELRSKILEMGEPRPEAKG